MAANKAGIGQCSQVFPRSNPTNSINQKQPVGLGAARSLATVVCLPSQWEHQAQNFYWVLPITERSSSEVFNLHENFPGPETHLFIPPLKNLQEFLTDHSMPHCFVFDKQLTFVNFYGLSSACLLASLH